MRHSAPPAPPPQPATTSKRISDRRRDITITALRALPAPSIAEPRDGGVGHSSRSPCPVNRNLLPNRAVVKALSGFCRRQDGRTARCHEPVEMPYSFDELMQYISAVIDLNVKDM